MMYTSSMQNDVAEFHRLFGAPVYHVPAVPIETLRDLRKALVLEETMEFIEASNDKDVENVAKELSDILYVVFGAAIAWGIDIGLAFDEVHRSNMTKLWEDGKPRYREDGKVLKPPTYSKANMGDVFNKQAKMEEMR